MGKKKNGQVNKTDPTKEVKKNTILAVPEETEQEQSSNDVESTEDSIISEENEVIETPETNSEIIQEETTPEDTDSENEEVINTSEDTSEEESDVVEPITEEKEDNTKKENNEDNKVEEEIQSSDIPITNNTSEKKSPLKLIIIICIIVGLLLVALLLSTGFALFNNSNQNIINGTYIRNIDVSNLSKEQALDTLNTDLQNKLSKVITIKHNDYETQISLSQLELSYDFNSAINEVYSKGRSGNIFKDNFDIILSLFSTTITTPSYSYNKDMLNTLVKDMEINISDRLIEPTYYIDDNNLIISKGKDGYVIDTESLERIVNNIFADIDNQNLNIELPVTFKKADNIDIYKIQSEICKSPVNAYFTKDPYVIYPHVDGIAFAISIQDAQNLVNTSTEEQITIPLTITSPEITVNDIGDEAFPDELATFSTTYSTNNVSRSTNIRLASNKINGTVIMPGEVFSYNATVGQRTTEAGFQTAAVYSGGEVTTGIGGGICQVSSTLYNAVLYANLEIVERQNHGFNPGYVPVSRDATVSWGAPDFKFKNTRNYPVKIVCDGDGGTIDVQILGLKESVEYDVEIESYVTKWISYSTIERVDPNLDSGETRVIQSGSNGCKSVAYRILYNDGVEVSRELLSQDTYSPHNRIIAVGN